MSQKMLQVKLSPTQRLALADCACHGQVCPGPRAVLLRWYSLRFGILITIVNSTISIGSLISQSGNMPPDLILITVAPKFTESYCLLKLPIVGPTPRIINFIVVNPTPLDTALFQPTPVTQ